MYTNLQLQKIKTSTDYNVSQKLRASLKFISIAQSNQITVEI